MSSNFSIDPEFGEIVYHPKMITLSPKSIELCFLATSQKEKDVSEVFYDASARNMRKVTVIFGKDLHQKIDMLHISGNQSISRIGDVLDRMEIPVLGSEPGIEYSLRNLQFVP